ncbi:MAG TPA: hypothetical protein PLF88_06210 [Opitutaceae bacterium]|nr:hypothetical protein [Opitutaceae bacterium]HRJ48220.1 hypothetical protein [Opitutaceae bacterium]
MIIIKITFKVILFFIVILLAHGCASLGARQVILVGNNDALALAVENLGQKQLDSLSNISLTFDKFGTVPAVYRRERSPETIFDVNVDRFLEKLSKLKVTPPEIIPEFKVHIDGIGISYFIAADTGASRPQFQVELSCRIDGISSNTQGMVTSGRSYVVWFSPANHLGVQLYCSETLYRALILTILKATDMITDEELLYYSRYRGN